MHAEHAIGRFDMVAFLARAGRWPAFAYRGTVCYIATMPRISEFYGIAV